MRWLQQPQTRDRMGKLVQVLNQLLDARIDEPADRGFFVTFAEYQTWTIIQEARSAEPMEYFTRMLAWPAGFHDAIEQLQGDKLFSRDDHVRVVSAIGSAAEEIPGLVDGLGAARQNQRALMSEPVGIGNEFISAGAMDLHARNKQHLRQLAIELGFARPEIAVPLAQDDPSFREAGRV